MKHIQDIQIAVFSNYHSDDDNEHIRKVIRENLESLVSDWNNDDEDVEYIIAFKDRT